jgi:putative restriction endonuclease
MPDQDAEVRVAAFAWLDRQVELHGEVLPWAVLHAGFAFRGERVPLVSQQGIFKPRVLPAMPLSIRTAYRGPYDDAFESDELLSYAYRGTDPEHHDNRGLRLAMSRGVPLVYFYGVLQGRYLALRPAYVVGDEPEALRFRVALDDTLHPQPTMSGEAEPADAVAEGLVAGRRRYITSLVRQRLHQQAFRERILLAYREQCALCRLRHRELLDAAHIIADSDSGGEPVVENGLAMCKLHHAAFDRFFLGIRPDYTVELRRAVLEEDDGPMLLHGLKELHGRRIELPRSRRQWPDPERLAHRYEQFRGAP